MVKRVVAGTKILLIEFFAEERVTKPCIPVVNAKMIVIANSVIEWGVQFCSFFQKQRGLSFCIVLRPSQSIIYNNFTFSTLMLSASKKLSLWIFHEAPADAKLPHCESEPKPELPSLRAFTVK